MSGKGPQPLNSENMCMVYGTEDESEGAVVFRETHHAWNSRAVIEGIFGVYRGDNYLKDIHFKRNLKKITYRPICSIGE